MSKSIVIPALMGMALAGAACEVRQAELEPVGTVVQALESVPENETFGTPRLSFSWTQPDQNGVVDAASALTATLHNNSAAGLTITVFLDAAGLDHRKRSATIVTHSLAPNGSELVTIPLSTLPIQSVGMPSQLVLRAVEVGATEPARAFTTPMSYEFAEDYATVILRGRESAVFEADVANPDEFFDPSSLWMRAFAELEGKVTDATGSLVDFGTMTPMQDGGAYLGPSLAVWLLQDPASWPRSPYELGAGNIGPDTYRVCTTWHADFVDAGFGEDYITALGGAHYPNAYGSITIYDEVQDQVIWGEALGPTGCTKPIALVPGRSYKVTQPGSLDRDDLTIYAESNGLSYSIVTQMTPVHVAFTTNIQLKPGVLDNSTRTLAVAGQALKTHDTTLFSGAQVIIYPDTECPVGGGGSCLNGGIVYLGDNAGVSDTYSKVIIAHEIGHGYQLALTGLPSSPYSSTTPLPPSVCQCDHVLGGAGNNLHCLQSRHDTSSAITEGFAHYFAASTFNITSQADCIFPYYKEVLLPDPVIGNPPVLYAPPYKADCATPAKWLETQCLQGDQGVELDWMQFFWAVMKPVADGTTMADLKAIYNDACNGTCTSSGIPADNLLYDDLQTAAVAHYGALSPKLQFFTAKATQNGVNH